MSIRKWLFKKIMGINKERLNKHIEIIHKNTGKSKLFIKYDILKNFIIRGSGYTDYFRGNYINLTSEEKRYFRNC